MSVCNADSRAKTEGAVELFGNRATPRPRVWHRDRSLDTTVDLESLHDDFPVPELHLVPLSSPLSYLRRMVILARKLKAVTLSAMMLRGWNVGTFSAFNCSGGRWHAFLVNVLGLVSLRVSGWAH